MSKKFVAGIYAIVGLCLLASSAFAVNMNNAGWYLHVDIKTLKAGSFGEFIKQRQHQRGNDVDSFLNLALGKELKDQIEQVTLYGDQAGYKDFTLIAEGSFSNSARSGFFDKLKLATNHSTSQFNGSKIHQWNFDGKEYKGKDSKNDNKITIKVDDDEGPLELYSAELDAKMIIVSRDEDEVKAWLKDTYSKKNLQREGVFSVVVNLDKAVAHGGMNLGQEAGNMDLGFDSKMMQKLTQFSFSLSEVDSKAFIEVGLIAINEQVAMQLKNVVSGLIALQAMAGDIDKDIQSLVQNLAIEVDGVNLLLKTNISTVKLHQIVD